MASQDDPGAGDMGQVRSFAYEQGRRANELERTIEGVGTINAVVTADTVGLAGQAWTSRVADFDETFATAISWLRDRKDAALEYAEGVDSIATRADSVRSRISGMTFARSQVQSSAIPAATITYQVAHLDEQISGLQAELRTLADERDGLDSTFAQVLNTDIGIDGLSQWSVMHALYGDAAMSGDYGAYLEARQRVIDEAAALADQLASGDIDADGMARLEELLTGMAGDPEAASRFWTTVGGDSARDMLIELDHMMPPAGRDAATAEPLALALRESLSVGSQDWTTAQATRFTDAMWEQMGKSDKSIQTVSFLFNRPDEHPMGTEFTVATANMFDSWERDPFQVSGGPAISNAPSGGLMNMAFLESEALGRERVEALDPMGRVLSTLALDHDASLAWLTDGGTDAYSTGQSTGAARVEYWFGERPWDADAFSGAASVWESAMSADGGIGGGTYEIDSSVMAQQAELVTGVISALGAEGNPYFSPGGLSAEAQVSMGNALNASLPWLVETSIASDRNDGVVQFMAAGDNFVAPVIQDSELARVWGTVAAGDPGLRVLDQAVSDYRTQAVAIASLGEYTDVTWGSAMTRVAGLEGFHQGSVGGVEQYQARLADERYAEGLDTVSTVVGLIPVPGSEKIPGLVGEALSSDVAREVAGKGYVLLVNAAKGGATDYAIGTWGSSLDSAISQTNGELLAGWTTLNDDLAALANANPTGLIDELGASSVDTWRFEVLDVYSDSYKSTLTDIGQPGLADEFERARP